MARPWDSMGGGLGAGRRGEAEETELLALGPPALVDTCWDHGPSV